MSPTQKIEAIRDRVCDLYGVSFEALVGGRRSDNVVRARHMAAALAFEFVHEWTMQEIADCIGMSAHTGVRYGLRKVQADPRQKELYTQLCAELVEQAGDPADWKPLDPRSK